VDKHHVLINSVDDPIDFSEVISQLKITGAFENAITQLIEMDIIRKEIGVRGVLITDVEKREHVVARRQSMGLSGAMDLSDYCHRHSFHPDQWKLMVESGLLRQKLIQNIADTKDVEVFFNENKDRLKRVCVARIVCKERSEAERIYTLAIEDVEQFSTLARKYSIEHNSRIAGGHVGCIGRGVLPVDVESNLFLAEVNTVKGPYSQNGYWAVYLIEDVLYDKLTAATRHQLAGRFFSEWLSNQVLKVRNKKLNQENKHG
jgi:parvulin-like peptidyl-prolyl isomerase